MSQSPSQTGNCLHWFETRFSVRKKEQFLDKLHSLKNCSSIKRGKKCIRLDVHTSNRCIWLYQVFFMQKKPGDYNNQQSIF